MVHTSILSLLAESTSWAHSLGDVLAALPELVTPLPPVVGLGGLEHDEVDVLLVPCAGVLTIPVVNHMVGLVQAGIEGRPATSPAEAELVVLLTRLTVEGGVGGLRASALPSLTLVAIAASILHKGPQDLPGLAHPQASHVEVLRDMIRSAEPVVLGRALLDVARRLQLTLDWVDDAVVQIDGTQRSAGLARSMLDDGLILAMPRVEALRPEVSGLAAAAGLVLSDGLAARAIANPLAQRDKEAAAFRAALRRWDVARALIDRLALLSSRPDGGWTCALGALPGTVRNRLLSPAGRPRAPMWVVAVDTAALQVRIENDERSLDLSVVMQQAWRDLAQAAPEGLHQRTGVAWLSVFSDVLQAVTFVEQLRTALSAGMALRSLLGEDAQIIDGIAPLQLGLSHGPISGGTDGRAVALEGAAVARALGLAVARPRDLQRVARQADPDAICVHCDADTSALLLTALDDRSDRESLHDARLGSGEVLSVRGMWDSGPRRLVLIGRGSSLLVELAPHQLDALLRSARAGTLDAASSWGSQHAALGAGGVPSNDKELLFRGREDALEDHATAVSATAVSATAVSATTVDSELEFFVDDLTDDPTIATEPLPGRNPQRAEGLDSISGRTRLPQTGGPSQRADPGSDLPAWDATGFSLPDYSQDMEPGDMVAALNAAEDTQPHLRSYSLEVDDDYGFEDDGPGDVGQDVRSGGKAPRGSLGSRSQADAVSLDGAGAVSVPPPVRVAQGAPGDTLDFDVFAWKAPPEKRPSGRPGSPRLAPPVRRVAGRDAKALSTEASAASSLPRVAAGADIQLSDFDQGHILPFVAPEFSGPGDEDSAGDSGQDSGQALLAFTEAEAALAEAALPATPVEVLAATNQDVIADPVEAEVAKAKPATGGTATGRRSAALSAPQISRLFDGYVVVTDRSGCFTFGLRDGGQLRDAHTYDTSGDSETAYRSFVRAKVAEGFVPRLDLWSPLPTEGRPAPLDAQLLQVAYMAMIAG